MQGTSRLRCDTDCAIALTEVEQRGIGDDKGAVATGLKKSDFRLFEDGVEQDILYFERERVPVSFVILADLSSSMTRKIPFVQEAALSLLDSLQELDQHGDEYSVL